MLIGKITKISNLANNKPDFMGEGDMLFDELVEDIMVDIKTMEEQNIILDKLTVKNTLNEEVEVKNISSDYLNGDSFELIIKETEILSLVLSNSDGSKFSIYYFH